MTAVVGGRRAPAPAGAGALAARPPAGAGALAARRARHPVWPTVALLGGYPVAWLLGVGSVVWIALPAVAALSLASRRRLLVPPGFLAWCGFLVCMVLSAVMLETRADTVPFVLRAGYYLGATVVLVDVLNGGERLSVERVHRLLVVLFLACVVGGLLGVLAPSVSFRSPVWYLLPEDVRDHPFVADLITPVFAEVQQVRGVRIARPSAPFAYTNAWGAAVALLVPFAVAAAVRPLRGLPVRLVRAGLVVAAVPVLLSLNRGLWFGLALAGAYVAARHRPAGRAGLAPAMVVVVLVVGAVVVWTPLGEQALSSLSVRSADSDSVRSELITETIDRIGDSPWLGFGGPRPSGFAAAPLGTHGQLWTVLFSHGVPAAAFYVGFLAMAVWTTRNPRTPVGVAAHVTLVVGSAQLLFYGQLPHQLFVLVVAYALAVRDRWERVSPLAGAVPRH